MLGRTVASALLGLVSGLVMLYALAMVGHFFLSCTADAATKSFSCGPQDIGTRDWLIYGLGVCWVTSIPGFAAFGVGGLKPRWAARTFAMATAAFSFVVLYRGYDIATTLRLTDRSLIAFLIIWLVLPPAFGLFLSGLMAEEEEEPEPYTGLETYSATMQSR